MDNDKKVAEKQDLETQELAVKVTKRSKIRTDVKAGPSAPKLGSGVLVK